MKLYTLDKLCVETDELPNYTISFTERFGYWLHATSDSDRFGHEYRLTREQARQLIPDMRCRRYDTENCFDLYETTP